MNSVNQILSLKIKSWTALGTDTILMSKNGAQVGTSSTQSLVKAFILGNKGKSLIWGEEKCRREEERFSIFRFY